MNRKDHLEWAKERAAEYCDAGDVVGAMTSFQSDMNKHDETRNHIGLNMLSTMYLNGFLSTPAEMRKFIEDFN